MAKTFNLLKDENLMKTAAVSQNQDGNQSVFLQHPTQPHHQTKDLTHQHVASTSDSLESSLPQLVSSTCSLSVDQLTDIKSNEKVDNTDNGTVSIHTPPASVHMRDEDVAVADQTNEFTPGHQQFDQTSTVHKSVEDNEQVSESQGILRDIGLLDPEAGSNEDQPNGTGNAGCRGSNENYDIDDDDGVWDQHLLDDFQHSSMSNLSISQPLPPLPSMMSSAEMMSLESSLTPAVSIISSVSSQTPGLSSTVTSYSSSHISNNLMSKSSGSTISSTQNDAEALQNVNNFSKSSCSSVDIPSTVIAPSSLSGSMSVVSSAISMLTPVPPQPSALEQIDCQLCFKR